MEIENDLSFRVLTLDIVNDPPPTRPKDKALDYCTVRMVGRTEDNKTVCVWAQGFYPYFFLKVPAKWQSYQLNDLRQYIIDNGRDMESNLIGAVAQESCETYCFSDGKLSTFIKLMFRGTRSMNACKKMFHNVSISLSPDDEESEYQVCEHKGVPVALKYLHDRNVQPAGWVTIAKPGSVLVPNESRAHFNIHTPILNVSGKQSEAIPAFKEASFDGEMISPTWEFPRPERPSDVIAQIAVHFSIKGDAKAYRKVLFCLDAIGSLKEEGIEVRLHSQEEELLMDFSRVMVEEDPDILTGYNTVTFDWPYILKRGELLKLPKEFFALGRFQREYTKLVKPFRSNQKDDKKKKQKQKDEYDVPIIPGRRIEDCHVMDKKFLRSKRSSYKLDDVAMEILGRGKHDVTPQDIFRAYQDTTDRLASYDQIRKIPLYMSELQVLQVVWMTGTAVENNSTLFRDELGKRVCSRWPPANQRHVASLVNQFFGEMGHDVPLDLVTLSDVFRDYVLFHSIGNTLLFPGIKLDMDPNWLKYGVNLAQWAQDHGGDTLEETKVYSLFNCWSPEWATTPIKNRPADDYDPSVHSVKAPSKEGKHHEFDAFQVTDFGDVLKKWQDRLEREKEIIQFSLDHKTTRRLAEKLWQLVRDVKEMSSQPGAEDNILLEKAQAYIDHACKFEQQFLLSEKTRVGKYCMVDAELPWAIRVKKQHMIALMEMSKVSGVPPNMIMEKGETIKVINLFIKWCRANNYVATLRFLQYVAFVGGEVLTPEKGFYDTLVATLDFNSLYPSLIQSHKLCFLSLIHPDDLHLYKGRHDLEIVSINIGPPSNQVYHWVVNRRTALPEILAELVKQRKIVKAQQAAEEDPVMEAILNQRQNAFKLVANATYGFTGFEYSPWPCLPIAVCTTVKGRNAIQTAKSVAETEYGARVIYGDTDSIMVIFPGLNDMPAADRLPYVFDLAKKAAARISAEFTAPMRIEFEKVYYPYLLLAKKRYSGYKYMKLDAPPDPDTKGMENVRRDNCSFLRDSISGVLDILMKEKDPGKSCKAAVKAFERLANQDVSIEELTISKALSGDYANDSHIHLQVAKYLEEKYPLLAPSIGDRVPYVIVKLPNENRATKAYMKGYNPELAVRDKKEIDWHAYCYKQLKKPMDRIFCVVFGHEYVKNGHVQPTDALWSRHLKKINDNDKIQQGRVNGNGNLNNFFKRTKMVKEVETIINGKGEATVKGKEEAMVKGKEEATVKGSKDGNKEEDAIVSIPRVQKPATKNGNIKWMFEKKK